MIINKKFCITLGLLTLNSLLGCATSPWHENLMSNNQLVAANCEQLAVEQSKVADNAQHTAEAASGGGVGAILLAVLEAVAASGSGQTYNANNSAGMNQANLADEHSKQAAELEQRRNLIDTLRRKKGCA